MLQTAQELTINVSNELTLTPFTGASLINEILKGLLYQKCQIPYPYTWLKQVVEKRRQKLASQESQENTEVKRLNITHENHYRIVSTAYDHLDAIMKDITKEFCLSPNTSVVEEVVVVFGTSPHCPKEVFTITLPAVARGHIERNHSGQLNKHLQKVLRTIFLSQTWMDSIDASISCTNTYVYLKKLVQDDISDLTSGETFERCQPLNVSSHIKHSKFRISCDPSSRTSNCCDNLIIFDESTCNKHIDKVIEQSSTNNIIERDNVVWCRSKGLLKGFKDCFVNKVSVCELW